MPRIVTLKQAAELTGLSEWSLRQFCRAGKLPHFRAGSSGNGKFLLDLDLTNQAVHEMMLASCQKQPESERYGKIRPVVVK